MVFMALSKKQKEEKAAALKKRISAAKVVAVVNLQNLPSKHFNKIRAKVRGQAEILMSRATLLRRALSAANPAAYKELEPFLSKTGSVAIMLTGTDPFKMAKVLRQNKSKAPAKAGAVAASDLVVPAGETNLAPGPVLTELKQAKINAKIQGTKIVIVSDAVVAKKGEQVSAAAAGILSKLGIAPFEIGLSMSAAYSDGMLYKADALDIDDLAVLAQLVQAHAQALNLAVFAEIYNSYSAPLILASAHTKALALKKAVDEKAPKKEEEKQAGAGAAVKTAEPATADKPAGEAPAQ